MVAEHADLWNIAGVDVDDARARSALLDRYCAEIGRDPTSITRSFHVPVTYDDPASARDAVAAAGEAGFAHFVLALRTPYPEGVARWVAEEIIILSRS